MRPNCAGLETRWIKHPANWLRAGCWKDEPAGRTDPRAIDGTTGIIVTRRGATDAVRRGPMCLRACSRNERREMGINIAKLKATRSLAVFDAPLPAALVTALAIGKRPSIPRTCVADTPATAGQAKLEPTNQSPKVAARAMPVSRKKRGRDMPASRKKLGR